MTEPPKTKKICIFGKEKYCRIFPGGCPTCRMYKTVGELNRIVGLNPYGNR